jgi:hypothetical protein
MWCIGGNMKVFEYLEEQISTAAFFLSPRGELLQSDAKHITSIIKNPSKFGLTKKEIDDIYQKHGEKIGTEGNAREEIIERLLKNGWIRIRRYPNKYWSVTIYRMARKLKDMLHDWANKMLTGVYGFMESDPYMPVKIVSPIVKYSKEITIKELANVGLYEENEYDSLIYNITFVDKIEDLPDMIVETSLSRVIRTNEDHDCGSITAFRKADNCGYGKLFTKQDNMKRNKSLLMKLKSKGYGVTKVIGKYPEGGKEHKEISYFVADIKDTGALKENLISLGSEFEQDSILFIPKGSILGKEKSYIIGTNNCPNNWLGYGKKLEFSKSHFGKDSELYITVVGGKKFVLEDDNALEIPDTNTGFGEWALHILAGKKWEEIEYDPNIIFEVENN